MFKIRVSYKGIVKNEMPVIILHERSKAIEY
jgi:hypothetical protein